MKIAVVGVENFPLGKKTLADERLEKLTPLYHSPKSTPIQIEFQDASHVKEADAILCDNASKLDLILADLELVEQRIYKEETAELFKKCKDALEKETPLNELAITEEELKILANSNLVTIKPITFIDSKSIGSIPQAIKDAYYNSGMISFFTGGEKETRAWAIKKGATALEAAGTIHSDIQRGFIKAEVAAYEDLIKAGGPNQARNAGAFKLHDKDYVVKDGDVILFKFNV
jgi:ribosome-binding ATPase YchF (GTP1/OBG family)